MFLPWVSDKWLEGKATEPGWYEHFCDDLLAVALRHALKVQLLAREDLLAQWLDLCRKSACQTSHDDSQDRPLSFGPCG